MEINWISVIKNGNPKEDGEYLATYVPYSGGPKVAIQRFQSGKWWFDGLYTIVVAYADVPVPYDNYRNDIESL